MIAGVGGLELGREHGRGARPALAVVELGEHPPVEAHDVRQPVVDEHDAVAVEDAARAAPAR